MVLLGGVGEAALVVKDARLADLARSEATSEASESGRRRNMGVSEADESERAAIPSRRSVARRRHN